MGAGGTEKTGSQRQKLLPKIRMTSCRQRNNFSAVSLTSVLSASHKNPQKIFSVPVQRHLLPRRHPETVFGSLRLRRRSHLLFMPISRQEIRRSVYR